VPIEQTAGEVRSQLELFVRHIRPDGIFTANTNPSDTDMDLAINVTMNEILTCLAQAGYGTDHATYPVIAQSYLSRYNALGAAWQIEMAHQGGTFSTTPETRGQMYKTEYDEWKKMLLDGTLSLVPIGVPSDTSGELQGSSTGISKTDKDIQEEDTDAVKPSFTRRGFANEPTLPTAENENVVRP
jgi:hypothetical protein